VRSQQLRWAYRRLISVHTGRPCHLRVIASALASVVLAGCADSTQQQGQASESPVRTSHSPVTAKDLGCGRWAKPGSHLAHDVQSRYGEIDGCVSVDNVWVMTTDLGSAGVGSIGYHLCRPTCTADQPRHLSQWRFVTPHGKNGTFSRLAGVNPDGTILFVGGSGELSLNTSTGVLRKTGQ
jgi:hypothetical protein